MTEAPTETSKRAEFFAGEMTSAPKALTSKGTERTFRLAIRDDDTEEDLFVYMMDHKDFWYNVDNTRIIASREQWEAKEGKILDAINDVEVIEDFLLNNPDYGDKTTEELADKIDRMYDFASFSLWFSAINLLLQKDERKEAEELSSNLDIKIRDFESITNDHLIKKPKRKNNLKI